MYSKAVSTFILISLVLSVSASAVENASAPQIAGKPANVRYPFIAQVTGNDVYVRSGKGTAYYHCGKTNFGDKVTVVDEIFGWAKVVPPAGSYSWIHKDYINIAEDSSVGVLNGDNVRVWAGSDYIEPMRSSSMQTKLNKGEKVELLPDQPKTGDYYKIKPPAGAYLWINCAFLKYAGPVAPPQPDATAPQPPAAEQPVLPPSNEKETPVFTNIDSNTAAQPPKLDMLTEKKPAKTPAGIKPGAEDSEALKQCFVLSAKIDLELKKPLNEQNYTGIRKALEKIQAATTEEKAVAYAQILQERIKRYELAISVVNTLKEQDAALAKTKKQIEKAYQAKLKKLPEETGFIYSGVLKLSHIYTQKTGQKRYLIQGAGGKILCYVIAASAETAGQLDNLIGTKVGIQGTVISNPKSPVALISATAVQALQ